jgi:hypothetical protein
MSAKTIWPIRQLRADFHAGHISKAEAHLADTIADLLVESGRYPHREWQPLCIPHGSDDPLVVPSTESRPPAIPRQGFALGAEFAAITRPG